jgi:hypothetical protein
MVIIARRGWIVKLTRCISDEQTVKKAKGASKSATCWTISDLEVLRHWRSIATGMVFLTILAGRDRFPKLAVLPNDPQLIHDQFCLKIVEQTLE